MGGNPAQLAGSTAADPQPGAMAGIAIQLSSLPRLRQHLRLLQHQLRGALLLVGHVSVMTENALDVQLDTAGGSSGSRWSSMAFVFNSRCHRRLALRVCWLGRRWCRWLHSFVERASAISLPGARRSPPCPHRGCGYYAAGGPSGEPFLRPVRAWPGSAHAYEYPVDVTHIHFRLLHGERLRRYV